MTCPDLLSPAPTQLRRLPRWGVPLALCGLPLALMLSCSGTGESPDAPTADKAPETAQTQRPDVVLVTLDTTRADRLGAYGHDGADTDWIDAKAKAGMRFDRAYAVQPLTIPSHASIMTGLWPWNHGVRSNGDATLDDSHLTMAERFKAGGWQTGASVAAFVTSREWGFAQGFDVFQDQLGEKATRDTWHQHRPADQVIDDAISFIEGADERPAFLWVHVYDAHFPYAPPEGYAERFPDRPYDGELAFVDDQLERLDVAMKAKGRDPIWVLVGDHGESLGEHRELTHGLFVYDATQHVPFIISGPGVPTQVVQHPVSQVDLLPTVMSLAGRPVPDGMDGKVQPGNAHPAWMESFQLTELFGYAPHTGVVDGDSKLISKPKPELYDLKADPGERTDLADSKAAELARMKGVLEVLQPSMPTGRTQALDPESLARLQALGYVATSTFDVDFADLPDPSDHKEVIGKVLRAEMMSMKGQHDEALALMSEALTEQPDVPGLHARQARMLNAAGKIKEAVAAMDAAAARFPDDVDLLLRAASSVGRTGADDRSLELARQALAADPENERAAEFVTGALINLRRLPEALSFTETWMASNPDSPSIAALRGILLFDGGDLRSAEALLRQAAKASRPRAGVCQRLGAMALGAKVLPDAEKWLRREIELHGRSPRTDRLLMTVLARQGEDEQALALADELLVKTPDDPELLHARGASLFDLGRVEEAATEVAAALATHPGQPDLLMLMANIQLKQGKTEEAQATKAKAEAAHKERVDAMQAAAEAAKAAAGGQ